MTDSKPSIIFHIGQHKTGSKALQSFLAHNHQRLLDHHILYPIDEGPRHGVRAYAISQYLLFASIRREALAVCADQARGQLLGRATGLLRRMIRHFPSSRPLRPRENEWVRRVSSCRPKIFSTCKRRTKSRFPWNLSRQALGGSPGLQRILDTKPGSSFTCAVKTIC